MTNPYDSQSISGYNASPPADDGSVVESNRTKWATIKTKITDPVKTLAEAINTELLDAFSKLHLNTILPKTANHTVVAADERKLITCTNTITITLLAAATAGAGFTVGVKNIGVGIVTIDGDGTETIDTALTIEINVQNDTVWLVCDGSNWLIAHNNAGVPQSTNLLINPNFQIWQRGTSIAVVSDSYGPDRWKVAEGTGGTITVSQQSFTLGQTDVPGEPEFLVRVDQTVAASSGVPEIRQRIESVRTLAGQQATFSFWAKVSSGTLDVTPFATQNFGTGGSPSGTVATTGSVQTITASWQKFIVLFSVPSITGKTLGTGGDDYLAVGIETQNGTTYTLDCAQWKFEPGTVATAFELPDRTEQIALCERFHQKSYNLDIDPGTVTDQGAVQFRANGTSHNQPVQFRTRMRAQATMTNYSPTTGASGNWRDDTAAGDLVMASDARGETTFSGQVTASVDGNLMRGHWVADAEL